jgi:RHS repeat-associated protein
MEKIATVIRKLTGSLEKLRPLMSKLEEIWASIKKGLSGLRKAEDGADSATRNASHAGDTTAPSGAGHTAADPHMPDSTPHSGGDGTAPASTSDAPTVGSHAADGSGPHAGDGTSTSSAGRRPDEPAITNDEPAKTSTNNAESTSTRDPVDLATGRVFLDQTDVELPGTLPLVLTRSHRSDYRYGRLFGSRWASTLDQKIELAQGVVHYAAADGALLTYPSPQPGDAVLPVHGAPWPLTRHPDGGYMITIPQLGHTLHFAANGATRLPISAITDRNHNRIEFAYDATGTIAEIRHSGGYRIAVDTEDGMVTGLRLIGSPRHAHQEGDAVDIQLKRFRYNDDRRLVETRGASTAPTLFSYDHAGRLTRWEDANGMWYRYVYDPEGRCVESRGKDGFLDCTIEYDVENRVTRATDSLGNTTTYQLNEQFQVAREIDPLGNATSSEWDGHHRLLSHTDALGRTTRYVYDEQGNPTVITRADGSRSLAEYNALGLPITIVQANGAVWRQEYDERGNLVAATDPTGARATYRYDESGRLVAITDALNQTVTLVNDDAGLPLTTVDALGAATHRVRDPLGRIVQVTNAVGDVSRFGWTARGKLARRTLPDGATERWNYDDEGNLVEYVDALGQPTRIEYDGFDLPTARTDPDGTRLEFAYDTELRLVSVTNPQGQVWRYAYDPAGRLVREQDFDGRVLTYSYDAAGQLATRTNGAGQVTAFVRNELGKVVEQRTDDDVTVFRYDPAGLLLYARNQDAELSYQRDSLGRVLAETCNGRTVWSAYDACGRRVLRRTPSNADSVWEYDAADRPVALRTAGQVVRFGYDAEGREVQRQLNPVATLTQTWDANHRLRSQVLTADVPAARTPARGPRLTQRRSYSYRPDGHLTRIIDSLSGVREFDLDRQGRVTAVHAGGWAERYAYDPAGNLAQSEHTIGPPAGTPSAVPGPADPPTRHPGNVHSRRDANGRVVLRAQRLLSGQVRSWQYSWDTQDRLVAVLTPDGHQWVYRYDPLGRRIAKERRGPGTTNATVVLERVDFVWDGFVLAEQTHASPGGPARNTVWDWEPDRFSPVTQIERVPLRDRPQEWVDDQFFAIVTDLVGTPAELVDAGGNVAWHATTTLWGSALRTLRQERTDCPLRFPGQYHDQETGLHYNYQRYYDPDTGQYQSIDPLGLAAGPNARAYVPNPFAALDPLGLAEDCELALNAAKSKANQIQAAHSSGKTRPASAAGLSKDGQTFTGASTKGETPPTLDPRVQEALDNIPPELRAPGGQHGRCGEPAAISDALNHGVDPAGGKMAAVEVRAPGNPKHGIPKPACNSCKELMKIFGITGVTG